MRQLSKCCEYLSLGGIYQALNKMGVLCHPESSDLDEGDGNNAEDEAFSGV